MLTTDTLSCIFSLLPMEDLKRCRVLNKRINIVVEKCIHRRRSRRNGYAKVFCIYEEKDDIKYMNSIFKTTYSYMLPYIQDGDIIENKRYSDYRSDGRHVWYDSKIIDICYDYDTYGSLPTIFPVPRVYPVDYWDDEKMEAFDETEFASYWHGEQVLFMRDPEWNLEFKGVSESPSSPLKIYTGECNGLKIISMIGINVLEGYQKKAYYHHNSEYILVPFTNL